MKASANGGPLFSDDALGLRAKMELIAFQGKARPMSQHVEVVLYFCHTQMESGSSGGLLKENR